VSCFDENLALQFVNGMLDADKARAVEEHSAQCAECRWLLAAAANPDLGSSSAPDDALDAKRDLDPRQGTMLSGDYRLGRLIGAGGMGTVYEATHTRLPRRFAVKLLAHSLHGNSEAVVRLRREAEVTSSLSHPHIVQMLDFNVDKGLPFIVMELLEGESLARYLEREGSVASFDLLASIVRQTTSAVGAAHERGVVHRDLKPTNLFLCRTDGADVHLKVMDFGISKLVGATSELTKNTAVLGSPRYMSPEQAAGNSARVDHRADIFALGAIIYRMLAGRSPFAADSVPATLYKVVHERPTVTPEWRAVPRPIQAVVLRALRKRPTARQASMQQFWREFERALRTVSRSRANAACGSGARQVAGPTAPPPVSLARRTIVRARLPLGIAALLAAGVAVAYFAARRPERAKASVAPVEQTRAGSTDARTADVSRAEAGGVLALRSKNRIEVAGRAPMDPLHRADETTADSLNAAARTAPAARRDRLLPSTGPRAGQRADETRARESSPRKRVRRYAWLTVQSKTPDGQYLWAEAFLDGRLVGKTPILNRRLRAGIYRLRLERAGYRTTKRRVIMRPGKRAVVSMVMTRR
jgi:tRNA A-37 threonylcarbamoyl transferase component Bud32